MEAIIKSFLGVFFIALITAVGISLLSASIYSRKMNSFATDIEKRVENSFFAPDVISSLQEAAKENGCTLKIESGVSSGDGRKYGRMTLEYPYEIKILGIKKTEKIERDLS